MYRPMSVSELKKRGRCCKSTCLHCPYGHTLKKLGLSFKSIKETDQLNSLNTFEIKEIDNVYVVFLKDIPCAVIEVDHIKIINFLLFDDFIGQGLEKEVVESYFFY